MSEREHVNEKDFVQGPTTKGRVMRLKADDGQALVHWTDNSETWVDLNTLTKIHKHPLPR